ncbi:hypothetical protein NOCA1130049 [metagenome]|uniref:Uncharacterized protein n=1 Tax=metagenome TaxID=256318 RepID=A0A2P2C661_9ZZZZ
MRPVSHAVKVVTTDANASAMIRPVAISIRLPLRMKFLKPVMVPPYGGPERAANERMPSTLAPPRHREELRQRRRGDLDRVGGRRADDHQCPTRPAGRALRDPGGRGQDGDPAGDDVGRPGAGVGRQQVDLVAGPQQGRHPGVGESHRQDGLTCLRLREPGADHPRLGQHLTARERRREHPAGDRVGRAGGGEVDRERAADEVAALEQRPRGQVTRSDQHLDGVRLRWGDRAEAAHCRDGHQGGGEPASAAAQLVAYGTQPASRRRESREHAPTLGRTARPALALSTGTRGQSEDELEDDELLDDVLLDDVDEDESDEDEEDVVDAGVVEDDAARLSVR